MGKPFKSIEEQIGILESRGVKTDGDTGRILLTEGYYAVVNGYKEPFMDIEATKKAKDDRYKEGTCFSDMHALFQFDRSLREVTFHYLLRAEALVRTTCSYTFSEAHRETEAYLDQSNFATQSEYERFGLKNYRFNMQKLHSELFKKVTRGNREFIEHYRSNHSGIPLWILANDMTFGNMEHFYNLMKPQEQKTVCKRIVEATGKTGDESGFFDTKEMRVGLDALVKFRNICAHDERLYCAKVGARKQVDYARLLAYLSRYLDEETFREAKSRVANLVARYSSESSLVFHILKKMGFPLQ